MANQYSDEIRRQFVELRAKGYTYPQISKEIGISVRTAQTWAKDMDEEITTAHADYITEILQEYVKSKKDRIDSLQSVIGAIDTAISEIDFTRVPPEKLLKLKLEYEAATNREYVSLIGGETDRDRAYTDNSQAEAALTRAKVDRINANKECARIALEEMLKDMETEADEPIERDKNAI